MNRYWSALLVALAIVLILACPHNPPNYPTGAIELHYYAAGPWPVTSSESATPCDSQGHKCVFFYPSNLGEWIPPPDPHLGKWQLWHA